MMTKETSVWQRRAAKIKSDHQADVAMRLHRFSVVARNWMKLERCGLKPSRSLLQIAQLDFNLDAGAYQNAMDKAREFLRQTGIPQPHEELDRPWHSRDGLQKAA